MDYKQLNKNERYQIYMLNKAGHKQDEIASLLGRSASTISRELRRKQSLRFLIIGTLLCETSVPVLKSVRQTGDGSHPIRVSHGILADFFAEELTK